MVQHGLVIHDFEIAGGVLAGLEQAIFGAVELVHLAVNLRDAEVDVGIVRHHVGELLINGQGLGKFFFGHQGLAETALVAELGGIQFRGLAVSLFGLG